MERTKTSKNIVTPWTFRDGEQYIVALTVGDVPKSLSIRIGDKITAEEWSCHYELNYIEELTQRTGNYKSFDVFIAMIKSALLKSTDSVELDFVTYEYLRAMKMKQEGKDETGSGTDPTLGKMSPKASNNSKKRYLIITYVAEFDSVHYPLPLTHTGGPDILIMQNNIKKLQSEVTYLRNTNQDMGEKLKYLETHERNNEMKNVSSKGVFPSGEADSEQVRTLLQATQFLERKVATERMEHLKEMQRIQDENNKLRDQIADLQLSEEKLNDQITRLEQIVSGQPQIRQGLRQFRDPNGNEFMLKDRASSGRIGRNVTSNTGFIRSRHSSVNSNRSNSGNGRATVPSTGKFLPVRNHSRQASPAPFQKFDPTAYVREKKLRQEQRAQTRAWQKSRPSSLRRLSGSRCSAERETSISPRRFKSKASPIAPIHTELRLAARKERSLNRERARESALSNSGTEGKRSPAVRRSRSKNRRQISPGRTFGCQDMSRINKSTAPKKVTSPTKLISMKSRQGNELLPPNHKSRVFEGFQGSLEALEAYIDDAEKKLNGYKSFEMVFRNPNEQSSDLTFADK